MGESVKSYYEDYWSDAGFSPVAPLPDHVRNIFETNCRASDACLDVGCGDGLKSGPWLTDHTSSYLGVDVSEGGVEKARSRGLDARVIDDAGDLPFEDSAFDVVTCMEVLEHLFRPDEAAGEAFRVLSTGGRYIVTVPNLAYWRRRVDLALFGRWNPFGDHLSVEMPWRDPHIRFFNTYALREMLSRTGFREIRLSGYGGSFLRDIPGLRRYETAWTKRAYRTAEVRFPSLLAARICAVAVK